MCETWIIGLNQHCCIYILVEKTGDMKTFTYHSTVHAVTVVYVHKVHGQYSSKTKVSCTHCTSKNKLWWIRRIYSNSAAAVAAHLPYFPLSGRIEQHANPICMHLCHYCNVCLMRHTVLISCGCCFYLCYKQATFVGDLSVTFDVIFGTSFPPCLFSHLSLFWPLFLVCTVNIILGYEV